MCARRLTTSPAVCAAIAVGVRYWKCRPRNFGEALANLELAKNFPDSSRGPTELTRSPWGALRMARLGFGSLISAEFGPSWANLGPAPADFGSTARPTGGAEKSHLGCMRTWSTPSHQTRSLPRIASFELSRISLNAVLERAAGIVRCGAPDAATHLRNIFYRMGFDDEGVDWESPGAKISADFGAGGQLPGQSRV